MRSISKKTKQSGDLAASCDRTNVPDKTGFLIKLQVLIFP